MNTMIQPNFNNEHFEFVAKYFESNDIIHIFLTKSISHSVYEIFSNVMRTKKSNIFSEFVKLDVNLALHYIDKNDILLQE